MSRRVARPYAQALFAVVKPLGTDALKQAEEALTGVAEVFAALPDLLRVFELPALSHKQKVSLLQEISRRLALPIPVQRLVGVLQSHYRLRLLPLVASEFRAACDRFFGVRRGQVEVPRALPAEELTALAAVLQRLLGEQVVLEQVIREELLAGFVVRLGSLVFDGSTKRQLERFAGVKLPVGGGHAG